MMMFRCGRRLAVLGFSFFLTLTASAEVILGSDVLASHGFRGLEGKRVALLTNPSGVNGKGVRTIDRLRGARGVRLMALMAPEHGIDGEIPAGQEFKDTRDPQTGLKVFSLYGPGPIRGPTAAMLKGLDAVVYDIQDTGCRSYTFISTMGLAMEACAEAGVEFVVLDRPNPLGGEHVEGPILEPRFRSMVGEWPVPYLYGMTCGELARMINGEGWIRKKCRLTIVPMRGWKRDMVWKDTGLPWVATSPNIPGANSPMYYASTGILGWIGGVSIGIGTDSPFQQIGAPWLDGPRFRETLNGYGLRGVEFRPARFTPESGAYGKKTISGVKIVFTDPSRAPKMAINFYALDAIRTVGGRNLFQDDLKDGRSFSFFDKVTGTDAVRKALAAGTSGRALAASWRSDEERFRRERRRYLLY